MTCRRQPNHRHKTRIAPSFHPSTITIVVPCRLLGSSSHQSIKVSWRMARRYCLRASTRLDNSSIIMTIIIIKVPSDELFDLFDDLSQSSVLLDEARVGTRQDIVEDGFCFLFFLLDLLGTRELTFVFRLQIAPVDIGQLVARLLP